MSRRILSDDEDDDAESSSVALNKSEPLLKNRDGKSSGGSQQDLSKALFGSSDEEEGDTEPTNDQTAEPNNDQTKVKENGDIEDDLFGEESDVEEKRQQMNGVDDADLFGDENEEERGMIQDDQMVVDVDYDEDAVEEKPVVTVEAVLPDISGPKDNDDLFLLKIPNFLSINAELFSHEEYTKSAQERDEDNNDAIILMENTIRWRYNAQKEPESNARIVRWSNGTFSLLIGEELFDVGTTNIENRYQFLTTQFPQEGFLKTQARLRKFMSFTPHSTQSLAHRNLIAQLARKHKKVNKTKQYIVMEDPEKIAKDAEKAELERIRARKKLEAKQEASLQQEFGIDRYSSGRRGAYSNTLDEYEQDGFIDQDEDDLDQYGGTIRDDEEGVDDDEDREEMEEKRLRDAKRGVAESSFASAQKSKRLRIIEDSDSE